MSSHGEISSQFPRFFRVILPQILQNETLELPRNFVKNHGKSLSNYACIKLPTGAVSKIELRSHEGRVWLHEGWRDFVEKYSIKCGYFLVFVYKGGSNFDVHIFDLSTSEIEYPISTTNKKAEKRKHIEDNDDEDEIIRISPHENDFRSSNLHFVVTIATTDVSDTSYLYIPAGPARSYLRKKGKNDIYLKLDGVDGRTWQAKYAIGDPPYSRVRICEGWTKFSRENHLRQGDICAFELIDSVSITLKITIFRITDEQQVANNCPRVPQGRKENRNHARIRKRKDTDFLNDSKALEKAKAFECKEPSFAVVMRKSFVQEWYPMEIPFAHSSKYLKDQHGKEALIHRDDGKSWGVKCYVRGWRAKFSSGWKIFAMDNELREGDACVFELFSQAPNQYNVTIFRVDESKQN